MAGLDGTNREYLTNKIDLCDLLSLMQRRLVQWDPCCIIELLPGKDVPDDECLGFDHCRECIANWLNKQNP